LAPQVFKLFVVKRPHMSKILLYSKIGRRNWFCNFRHIVSEKNLKDILNIEKAEYLKEQFEKRLDASIKSHDYLNTKATWLSGVLFGAIILLITEAAKTEYAFFQVYTVAQGIAFFSILLYVLFKCVRTKGIKPIGNEPRNLLTYEFLERDLPLMILTESQNTQTWIDENENANRTLGRNINDSISAIVLSPLAAAIIGLLYMHLSSTKWSLHALLNCQP